MYGPQPTNDVLALKVDPFPDDNIEVHVIAYTEREERLQTSEQPRDKAFLILSEFLLPDSTVSPNDCADSLISLLSNVTAPAFSYLELFEKIVSVAEQVPYQHIGHQKLAELVRCIAHHPHRDVIHNVKKDETTPHESLSVAISKTLNNHNGDVEGSPEAFVNHQAFVAHLSKTKAYQREHDAQDIMHFVFDQQIWDKAFQEQDRNSYALGAAQWFLWDAETMFTRCKAFHFKFWETRKYSMNIWRSWKSSFQKVSSSDLFGKEARTVAAAVVKIMESLEAGHPVGMAETADRVSNVKAM